MSAPYQSSHSNFPIVEQDEDVTDLIIENESIIND